MSGGAEEERHAVFAKPVLFRQSFTKMVLAVVFGRLSDVAIAICVVAACIASLAFAPGVPGFFGAGLACVMIAIAAIDAKHFRIPDMLVAFGFALVPCRAAFDVPFPLETLLVSLLRAVVSACLVLALRELYRLGRGREGIGLGDVKLAGLAGAWLDWTTLAMALELAAVTGLAAYAISRLFLRRHARLSDRLPFGLFFAPTIWLGWLFEVILGMS